jgi:molybdopterin/thiamine biosynthesis adenylyltransferase
MVKQVNPSLARLWLSDNSRRYGVNNRLTLEDLTEPEMRVLDYLEAGIADNQLAQLHKMAGAGLGVTQSLIERVAPLISKTSSFLPLLDSAGVQREFSEIMRLYLLEHRDPAAAMRKRLASKVFVSSLNRAGLIITRGLAASGLGTVFSSDQKAISPADTLELGYGKEDLGVQRARAAKKMISPTSIELHSRVSETYARADIAILLGGDVIDPARYAPWMARDVPHIGITFSELGATVSHLVLPGITPCLACIELKKLQEDAHWATTAPQLAQLDRDLADSSLILFAASLALSLTLNLIDGFEQIEPCVATQLLRTSEMQSLDIAGTNCGCRVET